MAGHTETVRVLAEAGADVFKQDKDGYCALELAQMAGHQETSCALIDAIETRRTEIRDRQLSKS